MGKRVNYAAHSVTSPDPNISMDEIGIPLHGEREREKVEVKRDKMNNKMTIKFL